MNPLALCRDANISEVGLHTIELRPIAGIYLWNRIHANPFGLSFLGDARANAQDDGGKRIEIGARRLSLGFSRIGHVVVKDDVAGLFVLWVFHLLKITHEGRIGETVNWDSSSHFAVYVIFWEPLLFSI